MHLNKEQLLNVTIVESLLNLFMIFSDFIYFNSLGHKLLPN